MHSIILSPVLRFLEFLIIGTLYAYKKNILLKMNQLDLVIREKSGRGEEERDERQESPQAAFEAAVGARGRKQRGRRCPPAHYWLLLMLAQAATTKTSVE